MTRLAAVAILAGLSVLPLHAQMGAGSGFVGRPSPAGSTGRGVFGRGFHSGHRGFGRTGVVYPFYPAYYDYDDYGAQPSPPPQVVVMQPAVSQQPAPAHLVGRELRVGEKILEPFRKHREKQILQFGVRWLTEQIQPIAKDVLVALENSPAGFEEAYIVLEKHVQEIQKDPAAVESFLKPLLEFAELQNERNRALYVDIQQKRLTSPSDFPAERCKEFIDSLTIEISKAEDLLKLDQLGELFKEVLRLSAETLRRKDLQKFFTKRGGGAVLKQMRKEIKKLT